MSHGKAKLKPNRTLANYGTFPLCKMLSPSNTVVTTRTGEEFP